MLCYWEDEESTKKTLTEDGWLKTGDQFVLQENGYGAIVGRLKDMLIRGGENIFPKVSSSMTRITRCVFYLSMRKRERLKIPQKIRQYILLNNLNFAPNFLKKNYLLLLLMI